MCVGMCVFKCLNGFAANTICLCRVLIFFDKALCCSMKYSSSSNSTLTTVNDIMQGHPDVRILVQIDRNFIAV